MNRTLFQPYRRGPLDMKDGIKLAGPISSRTKVLTLAPMAVASVALTAIVLTQTGAAGGPVIAAAKPLPDGTTIPTTPIQEQASPKQPGKVAPGIDANAINSVVATSSNATIPPVALNAYQRAASVINSSDPSCRIPWTLVAAIGRVESNHGQYGNSRLAANGDETPPLYGPLLDGTNGFAFVRDTDGGALDKDATYDRAVGPMQFLPSTWMAIQVDGNRDGKRDPQNIYDAALGAAVYLCSGSADLSMTANQRAAVFRYNNSNDYVNLVLRLMAAYQKGNYAAIGATLGPTTSPSTSAASPSLAAKPTSKATSSRPNPRPTAPATNERPTSRPTPTPSQPPSSPTPSPTKNPFDFLNGVTPKASTSNAAPHPMTSSEAASYCARKLPSSLLAQQMLCTSRVTGMTPAQADSAWLANVGNLAAWFAS